MPLPPKLGKIKTVGEGHEQKKVHPKNKGEGGHEFSERRDQYISLEDPKQKKHVSWVGK